MHALRVLLTLGLLLPAAAWSEAMNESPKPPVAAMKPHTVKSPNGNREDEYYWLRDDTRRTRMCSPTWRPRTPTRMRCSPT